MTPSGKGPLRILIAEPLDFDPKARQMLESVASVDFRDCAAVELPQIFAEYDAVWVRLGFQIDAAAMGPVPRARVLATPVTGLDQVDLVRCAELGIKVVALKGETEFLRTIRATAEHTLALTLALLRHIPEAAASVRDGVWRRDLFRGSEIHEQVVGIVGFGRLGRIVAEYFRALGAEVIAYDPHVDVSADVNAATGAAGVERADSLESLLRRADIVSLHVSYAPETHHLIAAPEFGLMKAGSRLVNTARGAVVDEAALLAALRSGHLAGAALDVLEGEPHIDAAHPVVRALDELPNLLVVPHIGGNTVQSFAKTERFLACRVIEALGCTVPD